MKRQKIELLAPARDLECGRAAIDHGADAIYIGSPAFSARVAASNSVADIEQLVNHAHKYFGRVYVALNTLLADSELDKAVSLIHQLYNAGIDGLIIQDLGLLERDLPPIPLHASTQCNNRTVEKIQFLERVGFEQAVLARELSLESIKEISSKTNVLLESFIHGALCVSYSGRCYISEVVTGRSANRGECAQFCRHRYKLEDSTGTMISDEHVLSLKDLNLSRSLEDLLDAGISSFKIEGRLKSAQYVKNITAYYRTELDKILERRPELTRISSGRCSYTFKPNPFKSFNRGVTDYYLNREKGRLAAVKSPKSVGQYVGKVVGYMDKALQIQAEEPLHNGDGCCYFNEQGELVGLRVNRAEAEFIYPAKPIKPLVGTSLYRNVDIQFNKELERSDHCRNINVELVLENSEDQLALTIVDEDGVRSITSCSFKKELAKTPGTSAKTAEKQLKKSGSTIFLVEDISVAIEPELFVAASKFNQLRRVGFEKHLQARLDHYGRRSLEFHVSDVRYPSNRDDLPDITNLSAEKFYSRHGLQSFSGSSQQKPLMHCKYCVRTQYGMCPGKGADVNAEPLYITDNTGRYVLTFDCRSCEMKVDFADKNTDQA